MKTKYNKIKYQLAKSCRAWRQVHDFSQKQVAEELGISQSLISRFELGKCDSTAIFFWYLARGFNPETDMLSLKGDYKRISSFELMDELDGR